MFFKHFKECFGDVGGRGEGQTVQRTNEGVNICVLIHMHSRQDNLQEVSKLMNSD